MKKQKLHSYAVVVVAAMLLATVATSMATYGDVFAYKKNQATSQANACGNGEIPTNVGCQNTGSQIQGDENSVALAAQQTFPEAVTPVPPTPPPVDGCEECLAPAASIAIELAEDLGLGTFATADLAIEAICIALESGTLEFGAFVSGLAQFASELGGIGDIVSCLAQLL